MANIMPAGGLLLLKPTVMVFLPTQLQDVATPISHHFCNLLCSMVTQHWVLKVSRKYGYLITVAMQKLYIQSKGSIQDHIKLSA